MESAAELWENVLLYVKQKFVDNEKKISGVAFDTWIKSLTFVSLDADDVAVLTAKSEWNVTTSSRYSPYLREAFENFMGFPVTIKILPAVEEIDDANDPNSYSLRELYAEPVKTDLLPQKPNEQYAESLTFGSFIVGQSNKFAHAACVAVAQNPAGPYNPLFIYGPSGLGKTHLLNAIKNEIHRNRPQYNILLMKGVDFTNGIVDSLKNGTINDYYRAFYKVNVLLVDDVQFIAGKERTQEEFFHIFNKLFEGKKQIVLASDRPPREIKALDERLRTRFEMGLIADIDFPDFETRLAIIHHKALSLQLVLPTEVCEFIAKRLKSNIRQLEGAVKKLKIYSSMDEHKSVNLTLAQLAVNDTLMEDNPRNDMPDKIFQEVCRLYGVSADDIRSKKRTTNIALARRVTMYVMRRVLELSLPDIGKEFSRDHSTVIYNIAAVEKEMEENSLFRGVIEDIIKNVTA